MEPVAVPEKCDDTLQECAPEKDETPRVSEAQPLLEVENTSHNDSEGTLSKVRENSKGCDEAMDDTDITAAKRVRETESTAGVDREKRPNENPRGRLSRPSDVATTRRLVILW